MLIVHVVLLQITMENINSITSSSSATSSTNSSRSSYDNTPFGEYEEDDNWDKVIFQGDERQKQKKSLKANNSKNNSNTKKNETPMLSASPRALGVSRERTVDNNGMWTQKQLKKKKVKSDKKVDE